MPCLDHFNQPMLASGGEKLTDILKIFSKLYLQQINGNDTNEPQLVVWGTDVAIADCRQKFIKFLQRFVEATAATNEPLYEQKLEEVSMHFFLISFFLKTPF